MTAYAAALLGVAPPPEEPYAAAEATMSEMAKSFWRDNRRVSNLKIKDELGVRLAHPDHRAGLRAILEGERRKPVPVHVPPLR